MLVLEKKAIIKKTDSQDLSSAKLDMTTTFGKDWQLTGVYIHFDGACSQDVTIKRNSTDGSDYDTVLKNETLSAATDFTFKPTEELLESGDEITLEVSTGGSTTAYATIVGKEV